MLGLIIGIVGGCIGLIGVVIGLRSVTPAKIKITLKESFSIDFDKLGVTNNSSIFINGKNTRELTGLSLTFYLKSFKDFEHKDAYKEPPELVFDNFEVLSITSNNHPNKANIPLNKNPANGSVLAVYINQLKGRYAAEYIIIGRKTDNSKKIKAVYNKVFMKDTSVQFTSLLNK